MQKSLRNWNMAKIKTIVFDLYNTLVEIKRRDHFFLRLYKISHDGFGMDISLYLQLVMKNSVDDLRHILPNEFSNLYDERLSYLEKELNSVVIYDEVIAVLRELKKDFQLFLISNLASPYKNPVYFYNLDKYFEKMIFSCDYGFLKPNREIFEEVEKITSNAPNKILMVGDSFKSDITGARNMNWNYLKINRKLSGSKSFEIQNLSEIRKNIIISE